MLQFIPCSALRREDGSYAPAYMLSDGRLERSGRGCSATAPEAGVDADMSGAPSFTLANTVGIVVVGDELMAGKASIEINFFAHMTRNMFNDQEFDVSWWHVHCLGISLVNLMWLLLYRLRMSTRVTCAKS